MHARAGPKRLPSSLNKILWVVGRRANADPLTVTATKGSIRIRATGDAGGGSGQIQRTTFRFPESGCWRLGLRWGGKSATLDVRVVYRR